MVRFIFSWPDFERRQGKIYPLALDLLIDYDKWIKNSFFGMGLRNLIGNSLPVQVLLPIGGSNTLRGFPQDRFLGKTAAVVNAEIRFPIFWRLGGVAGFDAGKVWSSPNKIDLSRWAANSVLGLRFYMDTFVVRADIGFGKETTGFFFNFGHIF